MDPLMAVCRTSGQVWPEACLRAMKAPQGVSGPPGGLTSTISGPSIQLIGPLIAPCTAPGGSSSISASPPAEERSS